MNRIFLALAFACGASLWAAACDQTPASTPTATPTAADLAAAAQTPLEAQDLPTLDLTVVERSGDAVALDLVYSRNPAAAGPRVAEIWLQLSDALTYVGSTAGEAATRASKELTVQPREGNQLRVVLMSTSNLNTLDSGPLARLDFKRTGDGEATVSIVNRMPIFAPQTAQTGMLLPEPLTIAR